MIIVMKQFEKLCHDYCKRYIKNWEFYCIASDSWLNGYKQCREDSTNECKNFFNFNEAGEPYELESCKNGTSVYLSKQIKQLGEESTLVEFKDGDHQLKTRPKSDIKTELKELLKTNFNCNNIHVEVTDKTISFQGTFKL